MSTSGQPGPGSPTVADLADDLAACSLSLARRFAAGATMWCCAPEASSHARHVAVEFVHPVIVGKRALPAVSVPAGQLTATLRSSARSGDILVALASASEPHVVDAMRRAPAWGLETVWIGVGARPPAGSADHVLWLPPCDPLDASAAFVRIYHLLWELTHVCFEHPGLLKPEVCEGPTCITCSDDAQPAEVIEVVGDEAVVRTPSGRQRIDTTLVAPPHSGDLLLVHAGSAVGPLGSWGDG